MASRNIRIGVVFTSESGEGIENDILVVKHEDKTDIFALETNEEINQQEEAMTVDSFSMSMNLEQCKFTFDWFDNILDLVDSVLESREARHVQDAAVIDVVSSEETAAITLDNSDTDYHW